MSLYQIMYISSAASPVPPAQCAQIAQDAAVRNSRDDVTGLLLFNGRRFLQVLEGPRQNVERIYERIGRDGRHRALVMLRRQDIAAREFGDWGMAYDDPAHPSESLRHKVDALLDKAGPSTRAHFIGSAEMHRP
ncbi:BLUF domain-containing protein [Sphingobium quisquiliarum]|nr:BLUF domain-containing protein [Sphingobium quisquiliarum]